MSDLLIGLAGACGDLADLCTQLAGAIDRAHRQAVHALKVLVAASVGTQVVGAICAVFSFGASEAVAQGAEAAEVAETAAEISAYLATFSTETSEIVLLVSSLDSEVLEIEQLLTPMIDADLVAAEPQAVQRLSSLPTDIQADDRLAMAANETTPSVPSRVVVGGPKSFQPSSLRGMKAGDVERSIPPDWKQLPSRRGGGKIFQDPVNRGRQIRIMPGYPAGSRPDPVTAGPYAIVSQNGVTTKVALHGNPTLT